MRIDLPVRRPKPFRVTALIDVIFILLLFFMLSSNFLRYSEIPIAGGMAAAAGGMPSIVLRVEKDGQVVVNGTRTNVEGLESLLEKIDPPLGTSAAVVGGRTGTVQDLVAVTGILRKAGLGVLLLHR
jgi:biopolymer transport protein ExbD